MAEILPNTSNDIGNRGCTNTTLAQFKGKPRQVLVNIEDAYRLVVMDGSTLGGKFKAASLDELNSVKNTANSALTKTLADGYYLAKTGKATSAITADTATSATKASQDASGNDIPTTYATKAEVTSGLSGKLDKTEKATSATNADFAQSVPWNGVRDKPEGLGSNICLIKSSYNEAFAFGGYRVWTNGLIEQWGESTMPLSGEVTVTLPKTFQGQDTFMCFPANVSGPSIDADGQHKYMNIQTVILSRSSIVIAAKSTAGDTLTGRKVRWYAIGK